MAPAITLPLEKAAQLQDRIAQPSFDGSRLAAYAALGATAAAVPLPWLPDSLLVRVRGALVHDIAQRHGRSLTGEARIVLSGPSATRERRGRASQALRFMGMRLAIRALARLGPVALAWPLRELVRTYALGYLFDRYLGDVRAERAVRIGREEALRVRRAIDGAFARAVTVDVSAPNEPTPIDDQRDAATAVVDALLGLAAGLPRRLTSRLDAAFDRLLSETDG